MTDRELFEKALEALEETSGGYSQNLIAALRERLAQPEQEPVAFVDPIWMQRPDLIIEQRLEIKKLFARVQVMDYVPLYTAPQQEPVIDKSAATRIATALGWVPPSDTSQERVDEAENQRQEQEPVVKWDASAPLVVTPHPAFQATLQTSKPWVGLTYGEVLEQKKDDPIQFYRAIEAKLKEKNT